MRIELSRRLLITEAFVFALPLTGLMALAIATLSISFQDAFWPFGANDLVTVLAAAALLSGWWLLIKGIRGSAEALRETHRGWWLAASLGCVLVAAAIVSKLLPASPEYSPAAIFREHLEHGILGLPLVAVLAHLWAEARLRKSSARTTRIALRAAHRVPVQISGAADAHRRRLRKAGQDNRSKSY